MAWEGVTTAGTATSHSYCLWRTTHCSRFSENQQCSAVRAGGEGLEDAEEMGTESTQNMHSPSTPQLAFAKK